MNIIECDRDECDGGCSSYTLSMVDEVLSNEEVVVYPTETLYGLGALAFMDGVKDKIREIKNSPPDKKISRAYNDLDQASEYFEIPKLARELEEHFMPGPITIVIETEGGTEGLRVPDHPMAQKMIGKNGPLTATSANIHGRPSPVDIETAKIQLRNKVKLYIDCGRCKLGRGSTVVKVLENKKAVEILREGAIPEERIEEKTKVI